MLGFAWDSAEFTATDAMEATGLTRSTTIEAMNSLSTLGLLHELPNARSAGDYRKGRPARRFELRDRAGVLVGIDAGHVHITVIITDLRSRPLATERVTLTRDEDDGPARCAVIVAATDRALRLADAARTDVLAVCVGVAAPVDSEGRSPQHPTGFWERMNPRLVDAFAWAPIVRVDNDASLAAVAEGSLGAAQGINNYITLLAGARLGAGVVVDGHLLRGTHGGVGEMVAFDHVIGVESADGLGARAAQWAVEAIARGDVAADSSLSQMPPAEIDGRVVFEHAAEGDADAQAIVDRVGLLLARVVSVLGSMFDPERVIVAGAVSAGLDQMIEATQRALPTDLDLPAPQLAVSQLGADVVVTGAIAAADADARSRVLDVWARARPPVSYASP